MIFLGRVLSWLMVVLGALTMTVNLLIAFRIFEAAPTFATGHSPVGWTTGEAIDNGALLLFAGLVLGLLTIIAESTIRD